MACRKEAAKARAMWFPKPTPKKEYHVYCVNAAEISDREKELERINKKSEVKDKPEESQKVKPKKDGVRKKQLKSKKKGDLVDGQKIRSDAEEAQDGGAGSRRSGQRTKAVSDKPGGGKG